MCDRSFRRIDSDGARALFTVLVNFFLRFRYNRVESRAGAYPCAVGASEEKKRGFGRTAASLPVKIDTCSPTYSRLWPRSGWYLTTCCESTEVPKEP